MEYGPRRTCIFPMEAILFLDSVHAAFRSAQHHRMLAGCAVGGMLSIRFRSGWLPGCMCALRILEPISWKSQWTQHPTSFRRRPPQLPWNRQPKMRFLFFTWMVTVCVSAAAFHRNESGTKTAQWCNALWRWQEQMRIAAVNGMHGTRFPTRSVCMGFRRANGIRGYLRWGASARGSCFLQRIIPGIGRSVCRFSRNAVFQIQYDPGVHSRR